MAISRFSNLIYKKVGYLLQFVFYLICQNHSLPLPSMSQISFAQHFQSASALQSMNIMGSAGTLFKAHQAPLETSTLAILELVA